MRALHSPMLQYGISVTANLELVSSHNDITDPAYLSNLIALSNPDLGYTITYPLPIVLINLDPPH